MENLTEYRRLAGISPEINEAWGEHAKADPKAIAKAASPDEMIKLLENLKRLSKEYQATGAKLWDLFTKQLAAGVRDLGIPVSDIFVAMSTMMSTGQSLGYAQRGPLSALKAFDFHIDQGIEAEKALKSQTRFAGEEVTEELSDKLDKKIKSKANADLEAQGLDGNKSFRSIGQGINAITGVLEKHGIELDDVPSADLFRGDDGRRTLHLAWTNKDDAFSPKSISNSMLAFQWHKHQSGNYELIAYLS